MELLYKDIALIISAFEKIDCNVQHSTETSTIFVNDQYLGRFAIDTKRKAHNKKMNLYFDGFHLPILNYSSFDMLDQFLGKLIYAKQHQLEHPVLIQLRENTI